MSSSNLLNINVDKLFEQYSIAEINVMQKKIQEVIENKKEELRTMVGERYRDLLIAADTITRMQQSSKVLITEVNKINGYCKNLNDQQLLGFKTDEDIINNLRRRTDNKQIINYYATMIQIKLLTILPDLIWSHLDRQQYFGTTELFLFSRHISTGLQLNANTDGLIQKLPIAKKQWEMLRPFHQIIKEHVLLALENDQLTKDSMVDCLMALLQLDHTTLTKVLKCFLNLRCTAFSNCLTHEMNGCGRIKERILKSLDILYNSLELIYQCFMEENGLLLVKLKEYSNNASSATINRIPVDDIQFANLLPDIILRYKPTFDNVALDSVDIDALLKEWFLNITAIADKQLKELFQLVIHMNVIQDIKIEANQLRTKLKFNGTKTNDHLVRSFDLKDIYELHYAPLINHRICDIIHDNLLKAINDTFNSIEDILKSGEYYQMKENTLNHMWLEKLNDLPQSLTMALNQDLKHKQLLMKCKGYGPQIITICTEFDNKLKMIINDINALLKEDLNNLEEKQNFIDFLKRTAQKQLNEFLRKLTALQTSVLSSSNELLKIQQQALLFLIHCSCALIELCPHLKLCFCLQQNYWRELSIGTNGKVSLSSNPNVSIVDNWHDIRVSFEDQVYQLWLQVIDNILAENSCLNYMPNHLSSPIILEDFPLWDCVTLEQKNENDQPIQSNFYLPKQPRISLQAYLHAIINKLNETVPQNLPNRILKVFNEKLMQHLLQYYDAMLRNHNDQVTSITHNVALQMYFDLKFLQNMFDVKERPLKEQFNTLQSEYRNFIDPFDFELLAEHIVKNIQTTVQKLNNLLGVLAPLNVRCNNDPTRENNDSNKSSSNLLQEKEPNVLRLCSSSSTSIWFPLLPIVSTSYTDLLPTKDTQINTLNKLSNVADDKTTLPAKKPPNKNNDRKTSNKMKTGTSSFFGSMSQEWFR